MTGQQNKSKSGFTLIELLVVISIISLLSSVVLSSLNSARAKSRDSRRLLDQNEIRKALELYASDNGGNYPVNNAWWGNCSNFGSHPTSGSTGYIPNLAPQYIPVLPLDPKPVGTTGCYLYTSNGTDYMMLVYGTVETYVQANNPRLRLSYPTENDFAIYSQGALGW